MSWPGPGFPRPSVVTLGRRGDICTLWVVGLRGGTDIHLPRGNPNRCDPGFVFSSKKAMASLSGVPYESYKSHRLFWTRCPETRLMPLPPHTVLVASFLLPGCAAAAVRTRHPRKRVGVQLRLSPVLSLPFGNPCVAFNSD